MKYQHALVTGGAGFIGSQLVRDLLAANFQVTVIDDFSTGKPENLEEVRKNSNLRIVEGSVTSLKDISECIRGVDCVFHLAVSNLRVSIARPELSHEVNATGTFNVLEVCRKQGIERFIYVSSSEVYGTAQTVPMAETHPTRPQTVYAASKLVGEYYTDVYGSIYGLKCTVVRPFNNYGPRSHWEGMNGEIIPRSLVRLKSGLAPIVYGDGMQTRDFIYVADTSRGLIKILHHPAAVGKTFNLAFGKEISMRDLCFKLCELVDPSIEPEFRKVNRPGDVNQLYADNQKIASELGIYPEINLAQGLEMLIEWFDRQKFDLRKLADEVKETNW